MSDGIGDDGGYDVAPEGGGEWYYADGQERVGPRTLTDLKELIADRKLGPEQLVWRAGMTDWRPAGEVQALARVFGRDEPQPAHQTPQTPPGQLGYSTGPVGQYYGQADPLAGQATAAMVLGIVALVPGVCCLPIGGICGLLAIIFGILAKDSPTRGGQALAGIICGSLALLLGCGFTLIGVLN